MLWGGVGGVLHGGRVGVVVCCWLVSAGRLSVLRRLYVRSIDPMVLWGAFNPCGFGSLRVGGGFPLRCFQRLSCPNVANQRCHWRDNWRTRGSSVPVLSY